VPSIDTLDRAGWGNSDTSTSHANSSAAACPFFSLTSSRAISRCTAFCSGIRTKSVGDWKTPLKYLVVLLVWMPKLMFLLSSRSKCTALITVSGLALRYSSTAWGVGNLRTRSSGMGRPALLARMRDTMPSMTGSSSGLYTRSRQSGAVMYMSEVHSGIGPMGLASGFVTAS